MIYIKVDSTNYVLDVIDSDDIHDLEKTVKDYKNAWDYKSFDEVKYLASQCSYISNRKCIPVDNGQSMTPRFDVMFAPKIGDVVSKAFNCDYYPAGKIVKITPTMRIITDDGSKFSRIKVTSTWKEVNSPFCLVKGNIERMNPEF